MLPVHDRVPTSCTHRVRMLLSLQSLLHHCPAVSVQLPYGSAASVLFSLCNVCKPSSHVCNKVNIGRAIQSENMSAV